MSKPSEWQKTLAEVCFPSEQAPAEHRVAELRGELAAILGPARAAALNNQLDDEPLQFSTILAGLAGFERP